MVSPARIQERWREMCETGQTRSLKLNFSPTSSEAPGVVSIGNKKGG